MDRNKPHARALRKGRVSELNRIYLVTTVTHQRKPMFSNWRCGRLLVQVLRKESPRAATLAFVIMPDHLHWLLQLEQGTTLSAVMRTIKTVSSRKINQRFGRTGRLWQPGFHDHALRKEEDLKKTARYIIANPLRAGLVRRIGDYPLWDAIWL